MILLVFSSYFFISSLMSSPFSFALKRLGFVFAFSLLGVLVMASQALAVTYTSDIYTGTYKVNAIDTDHFILEFSPITERGLDYDGNGVPDLVDNIADYAETSWTYLVDYAGLPSPLAYQTKVLLLLDDLNMYLIQDSLGTTSIMDDGTIYFAVDPSLSDALLQVTVAHEFMHVIQFSYEGYYAGYEQDVNFAEMSAVWAENYVYPDVDDYLNYLPYYFDDPDYSVFTGVIPEGSLFEYALGVWPIFVSEYVGDYGIIPDVVEAYFTSDPDVWDCFEAFQGTLTNWGYYLPWVYQNFMVWNYVPNSYYPDGYYYPWITIHASHYANEYPIFSASVENWDLPALYGVNYLTFEVDSSMVGSDFAITFDKPVGVDWGVVVLPESYDYYLTQELYYTSLPAEDAYGTVIMPIHEGDIQMTVMLFPYSDMPWDVESVDDAFSIGYEYYYSVNIGDYLAEDTAETWGADDSWIGDEMMVDDTTTDETVDGDKPGDEPGENLPEEVTGETDMDSLAVSELAIVSQGDDSVSLSWTRVMDDSVAGYYINYGTVSGVYDYYEWVDGAHITHYTVEDLPRGATYYFMVSAYTQDYTEGPASNEVSAMFEELNYSDVVKSHSNYYALKFLTYEGVLEGYPDGTFRPNDPINRAELLKVLVYSWYGGTPDSVYYQSCFNDVGTDWYAPYVCYAKELGWVEGYGDGGFHPDSTVTKAEALKMIMKYWGVEIPTMADVSGLPYDDVFGSVWYASYVEKAYELGILEEIGNTFGGNDLRTRAEVCEELFRLFVIGWMAADQYDQPTLDAFLESWGEFFL